jgi:XTP/dITP diphosphohydrolase
MNVILATRNPTKALQILDVFLGSSVKVTTLEEAGIEGEGVEDGTTLGDNAFKKALYVHAQSGGQWAMSDDTGLFIDALGGEPGIYAARWAGDVSTEDIMRYCLKRLEGHDDRRATFRTAVIVISPEGKRYDFVGEAPGTILHVPRCEPQNKMPYSSIFVPEGETLTWAEMPTEYENVISHRGKAFRQAREFLEQYG